MKTPFHQNLARLRRYYQLSVQQFAELLEVPRTTYASWETINEPTYHMLTKIGHLLGISLEVLVKRNLSTLSDEDLEKVLKVSRPQPVQPSWNRAHSPSLAT